MHDCYHRFDTENEVLSIILIILKMNENMKDKNENKILLIQIIIFINTAVLKNTLNVTWC